MSVLQSLTMKFHERFDINVGLEEAQRRFLNRVHNVFFLSFLGNLRDDHLRHEVEAESFVYLTGLFIRLAIQS